MYTFFVGAKHILINFLFLINFFIDCNPLQYKILSSQLSSSKVGGQEVKTSALVSRRSWVRILSEPPVEFFHRRVCSASYIHRCKGKTKSIDKFLLKNLFFFSNQYWTMAETNALFFTFKRWFFLIANKCNIKLLYGNLLLLTCEQLSVAQHYKNSFLGEQNKKNIFKCCEL